MNQFNNGMQQSMPSPFAVDNPFEHDNKGRYAIFHVEPVINRRRSEEAGYPVFEDIVMCRHGEHGDKTTIFDEAATDELKRRYSQQWAAFQRTQGEEGQHIGMDLLLLFPTQPSVVRFLKSQGIHTVEELASMGAEGARNVGMGAVEWQQKAQKLLAQAKDTAALTKMTAELEKRDEKIDAQGYQLSQLTEQIAKLTQMLANSGTSLEAAVNAPAKRGPGRPPKSLPVAPVLDDEGE